MGVGVGSEISNPCVLLAVDQISPAGGVLLESGASIIRIFLVRAGSSDLLCLASFSATSGFLIAGIC